MMNDGGDVGSMRVRESYLFLHLSPYLTYMIMYDIMIYKGRWRLV